MSERVDGPGAPVRSIGGAGHVHAVPRLASEEMSARQVRAHGRPGDVLVRLCTSGGGRAVIAAAKAATELGERCRAPAGPALADALAVDTSCTASVQEVHRAAGRMLRAAVDAVRPVRTAGDGEEGARKGS